MPISRQSFTGMGERFCSSSFGKANSFRFSSDSSMNDGLSGPIGLSV